MLSVHCSLNGVKISELLIFLLKFAVLHRSSIQEQFRLPTVPAYDFWRSRRDELREKKSKRRSPKKVSNERTLVKGFVWLDLVQFVPGKSEFVKQVQENRRVALAELDPFGDRLRLVRTWEQFQADQKLYFGHQSEIECRWNSSSRTFALVWNLVFPVDWLRCLFCEVPASVAAREGLKCSEFWGEFCLEEMPLFRQVLNGIQWTIAATFAQSLDRTDPASIVADPDEITRRSLLPTRSPWFSFRMQIIIY